MYHFQAPFKLAISIITKHSLYIFPLLLVPIGRKWLAKRLDKHKLALVMMKRLYGTIHSRLLIRRLFWVGGLSLLLFCMELIFLGSLMLKDMEISICQRVETFKKEEWGYFALNLDQWFQGFWVIFKVISQNMSISRRF